MALQSVLITGASGFIGKHLAKAVRSQFPGVRIVGLDQQHGGESLCDEFILGDMTSRDVQRALGEVAVDTVFHLAALCKEPGYAWRDYFIANYKGTQCLLAALPQSSNCRIVFTSTMMVFAAGSHLRDEASIVDPETAYGSSKALAEEQLRTWREHSASDRSIRIVRPGVVFGPGDYGNMPKLIRALKRFRFAYIGRSDTVKSCIYVKDLVSLLIDVSIDNRYPEVIHAAYPTATTLSEIVAAICNAWDIRRSPITVPYFLALGLSFPFAMLDPLGRRFAIHPRRIQKLFLDTNIATTAVREVGWTPSFSLDQAFRDWRREEEAIGTRR